MRNGFVRANNTGINASYYTTGYIIDQSTPAVNRLNRIELLLV